MTKDIRGDNMDWMRFLSNRSSCCALRKQLWQLFQAAEQEARTNFCGYQNPWVPITKVVEGETPGWSESGRIEIPVSVDDLGVIFHEVFHSAFHFSPLWYAQTNAYWGDAFCDAFRYLMEKTYLLGNTMFTVEMELELGKSKDQILIENNRYKGWGSRILLRVNKDYDLFKKFWNECNTAPSVPLAVYLEISRAEGGKDRK